LNQQLPATQITVNTEIYNGCWDVLFGRRADLVIGAPHAAPKIEDIVYQLIDSIEWDFIVGQLHPLVGNTEVLTAEVLRVYHTQQAYWRLYGQGRSRAVRRRIGLAHYGRFRARLVRSVNKASSAKAL
tara:strand:+ start:3996 stop:4379 length:384 start_codon:yes stop_codon:yes gene_type:complete